MAAIERFSTLVVIGLLLSPSIHAEPAAGEEEGSIGEFRVTASTRVLYPIAVPEILPTGGNAVETELASLALETLRADLEISGYFKQLPPDSFFFDWKKEGLSASSIQFKNWFNVGAQALIKGTARSEGANEVLLDLRLYMVDTGRQVKINWSPKPVARAGVRRLMHGFANEVVRHFTGQLGIFGTRIAYVRKLGNGKKAVYLMSHDGHERSRLSRSDTLNLLPAWNRQGTSLVYTSYAREKPDLYLHKLGASSPVALSSRPGMNVGGAFSPDGKQIALTMSKDGNSEIYILDATNGKIIQRVTKNWSIDSSPTWSPDAKRLAFVSDRSGTPQIYVKEIKDGRPRRITFRGNYNTTPEWSPSKNLIAFTARDERYKFDIFTVDANSGDIARLTQDAGNNEEPSWSPDGRYIVFTSSRSGSKRVYVMTADGQHQTCITPRGSGFSTPAWGSAR